MLFARGCAWVVGLAALSSCTVLAEYEKGTFYENNIPVGTTALPNDLRVIVEEDTGSPMVAVALVVGAGSRADPRGKEGVSHLANHLAFRSRLASGVTVRDALEQAGVSDFGSATTADDTTFHASAPRTALPQLLAIVARQLGGVEGVDAATFEVERKVVEAELARGVDATSHSARDGWLLAALYPPDSLASRPPLGELESLRALTPADVAAYHAANYRASNATLVITGGASTASLGFALNVAFGSAPTRVVHEPLVRPMELPPEPPSTRLLRHEALLEENRLAVQWSLPTRFDRDGTATFLADSVWEWIEQFSGEEHALRSWGCSPRETPHEAAVVCWFTLSPDADPERVFEFIARRVDQKAASDEPRKTPYDLTKLFAVKTSLMSALDRAQLRASRAANFDDLDVNGTLPRMLSDAEIRPERKWLKEERARGVSFKRAPVMTPSVASASASVVPAERKKAPSSAETQHIAWSQGTDQAQLEKLPNDLRFVLHKTPQASLVTVTLLLPGVVSDPIGAANVGWTIGHQNVALWKDTGAVIREYLEDDGLHYVLRGPTEHLESMLRWLYYRMLGTWEVDSSVLEEWQRWARPQLAEADADPLVRAGRARSESLWRGHPYGRYLTRQAFDAVTDGQAERAMTRLFAPGQAVLVVAGDVEEERTSKLVKLLFGALPAREVAQRPPPVPPRTSREVLVTPIRGMANVALTWGCQAPSATLRQRAVHRLLAAWLEAQLVDRLRLQRGLVYSSGAAAWTRWGGAGVLSSGFEVKSSDLGAALKQLDEVLEGKALTGEQLLTAAWNVVRERNGRYELASEVSLDLARAVRDGWPVTTPDDEPGLLTSVTVDEAKAALAACRGADLLTLTGDPDRIDDGTRVARGVAVSSP
jgi:zinc protease